MADSSKRINPKKLTFSYIDSLINQVYIPTEEMLKKFSSNHVPCSQDSTRPIFRINKLSTKRIL